MFRDLLNCTSYESKIVRNITIDYRDRLPYKECVLCPVYATLSNRIHFERMEYEIANDLFEDLKEEIIIEDFRRETQSSIPMSKATVCRIPGAQRSLVLRGHNVRLYFDSLHLITMVCSPRSDYRFWCIHQRSKCEQNVDITRVHTYIHTHIVSIISL